MLPVLCSSVVPYLLTNCCLIVQDFPGLANTKFQGFPGLKKLVFKDFPGYTADIRKLLAYINIVKAKEYLITV